MVTYDQALNRLAKWRSVFASKWLGTRRADDAQVQSVRDIVERTLILRVEVTALAAILERKGVMTMKEYTDQVVFECGALNRLLEKQFPGFKATDEGITVDTVEGMKTMAGWPP